MSEYRILPAADRDLREIWSHTALQWSEMQADLYLNEIFDCMEGIALNPHVGMQVDWVRPGYRRRVVRSHILFYRIAADGAPEIIRILHGRMDIAGKVE
jgi:toxin ParE1/3/4